MGTEKPDLTPSADVARVRNPTFATVWRGYDPNQVLEYLGRVADHVQDLEFQVRNLESELGEARRQDIAGGPAGQDPYETVSGRVADLVRTFDQEVEKRREETEVEADRILAEARAEADSIRLDAQGNAEEMQAQSERALGDAREQSDRLLSGLASRQRALLDELRGMRDRLLDTARDLDAVLEEGPVGGQMVIVGDEGDGVGNGESPDAASLRSREAKPEPDA